MISGTTGLLGCADGALLMQKEKRTNSKATLEVVGRDQLISGCIHRQDQESLVWVLTMQKMSFLNSPDLYWKLAKAKNRIC